MTDWDKWDYARELYSKKTGKTGGTVMVAVGGLQVASVYKIDALCYVAEDVGRKYAAHLGQFPPLVQLPAAAQKLDASPGSATYAPAASSAGDRRPPKLVATIDG